MKQSTQQDFNNQALTWFGMELKSWIPIVVVFIGLVGYIYSLKFAIIALEVRADNLEESNASLQRTVKEINDKLIRIDANTENTSGDIESIKEYFKIP